MADINAVYKDAFGVDFTKLKKDQLALFDQIVAGASSPEVVYVNGRPTYNPARLSFDQAVKEHGGTFTKDFAQKLGVYASWRAGLTPGDGEGAISELTRQKAAQAGIPLDKIEQVNKDRKSSWASGVLNRFSHLAPADDGEKSDKAEMKVDDTPAARPLDNPMAMQKPVQAAPMPAMVNQPPAGAEGSPSSQGGTPSAPLPPIAPDPGVQMPDDAQFGAPQGVTGPAGFTDQERLRQQGAM